MKIRAHAIALTLALTTFAACIEEKPAPDAIEAKRRPAREEPRNDRESLARPQVGSAEQMITEYLADIYERPNGNASREGRLYFMPEEPGLELLSGETFDDLRVYKASIWGVHWGLEEFPILVWTLPKEGMLQMGALEKPDDVANKFPDVLQEHVFHGQEVRRNLASLIGQMIAVFDSKGSGELEVASEESCERVSQTASSLEGQRQIASVCFSKGRLVRIVLRP